MGWRHWPQIYFNISIPCHFLVIWMANFHDTPPHLPSQDPRAWHEPMPKHPPMTQSFVYPAGHIFASPNLQSRCNSFILAFSTRFWVGTLLQTIALNTFFTTVEPAWSWPFSEALSTVSRCHHGLWKAKTPCRATPAQLAECLGAKLYYRSSIYI